MRYFTIFIAHVTQEYHLPTALLPLSGEEEPCRESEGFHFPHTALFSELK